MPLVVPDVGETYFLRNIVGKHTANTLWIHLYKSDTTPSENDDLATYATGEASFTGYANVGLVAANWIVGSNSAGYSNATHNVVTFASTAGGQSSNSIYGYYITSGETGQLLWAERFSDGPYPVTNNGDSIKITPYIELA